MFSPLAMHAHVQPVVKTVEASFYKDRFQHCSVEQTVEILFFHCRRKVGVVNAIQTQEKSFVKSFFYSKSRNRW